MAEHVDEFGRTHPPQNADEVASVLGFLDYQRATLAWKCSSLDNEGLRAKTAATTMTLGGLLKHMTYVEDSWFSVWLWGNPKAAPWDEVDWAADGDWDWNSARDDTPDELFSLWTNAAERSRSLVKQALTEGGLEVKAKRTWPDGNAPSLRWILLHMIATTDTRTYSGKRSMGRPASRPPISALCSAAGQAVAVLVLEA